jgi:hypothetical protein
MKKKLVVYGSLLIVSIAFIAGGFLIPSHLEILSCFSLNAELIKHIITELGIAGVIGFVLALTIENLSAEEFRNLAAEERAKIKVDVFQYVYGRNILPVIRDEIDRQILNANFMKKNHFIRFKLETIEDEATREKFILSNCKLEYEIHNLTKDTEKFKLRHRIDKSPGGALSSLVKFTRLSVKNSGTLCDWDEKTLQAKQKDDGTTKPKLTVVRIVNSFLKFTRLRVKKTLQTKQKDDGTTKTDDGTTIPLKPELTIDVRPKEPAFISVEYQGIRSLKGGRINFSFPNYTCDLDLTVHVPGREVQVSAGAFSPHRLQPGVNHDPSAGIYHWKLEKPLLSHQGIYIIWDPLVAQPYPGKSA